MTPVCYTEGGKRARVVPYAILRALHNAKPRPAPAPPPTPRPPPAMMTMTRSTRPRLAPFLVALALVVAALTLVSAARADPRAATGASV